MTNSHLRTLSIAIAIGCLAACAAVLPMRPTPVLSPATQSAPFQAYEARFAALIAQNDAIRLRNIASLPDGAALPDWLAPVLGPIEARAAAVDGGPIPPAPHLTPGMTSWPGRWRESLAYLYLTDGATAPGIAFRLPADNALSHTIAFRSRAGSAARIVATCDGDVTVIQTGAETPYPAGTAFGLTVPRGERDRSLMRIAAGTTACDLTITYPGQAARNLRIVAEDDPQMIALDGRFDICAEPAPDGLDPLERAFMAGRWLSQTCAAPPGRVRLLPEAEDGFNAKVAALTGAPLTDAQIAAGDPDMPLDFSAAPRLDLIYLSFLDLKADFSGAIITRALEYHAARGTQIRILATEMLEQDKDRDLYEGLAARWPNIQMQLFAWTPPAFAPLSEDLAALHRVHHVKLFATLSPDPGRSRAILGGRNIHDGFLYTAALDLSDHPELQSYGKPGELDLNYFATYHDFEVEFADATTVRTLAAHLSTFWQRDAATTVFRPFSIGTPAAAAPAAAAPAGMRHFLSAPYIDGQALEHYWVDLIDAAETSIEIVTPYLNPTPAIEAALNRAMDRGVDVTIVARIELYGDLGGELMTQMNMLFVERYADRLTLWEYRAPDVVLHSKMLLIDRRLTVLSSVNLNRRSFLHDTENGVAVLDPQFYRQVRSVIDGYIAQAIRRGPGDTDISPMVRSLFQSQAVRDLF